MSDVDLTERLLIIRNGKGGKDRPVPLEKRSSTALKYARIAPPSIAACRHHPFVGACWPELMPPSTLISPCSLDIGAKRDVVLELVP